MGHARRKPIITMLEEIRIFVMERIYDQRVEEIEWDLTICQGVTPYGYQKYEVRFNDATYGVDLIAKTCACTIWKLTRITCLHGVIVISSPNQDAKTYVSQSYSKEAYLKCYNYSINPLNGSDMWPEVPYHNPFPPKRRRLPSRSLVKRKRDAVERELSSSVRHSMTRRGTLIRCSICKKLDHNKKKCPSKQQTNTSATTQPPLPPPPPPEAAQQRPPPPGASPVPRRRALIGRSGRRQYSERIVKMTLRRKIHGVGSSIENPTVLD
uniref:SWIM-type domain-containing protein n=1 Tax=Lactuca sativa TaxID=4236 RepID=A0A9R1UIK2_LACSA|nr:hypothetical protein LSAT_V11C900506330 [Lactuca sativa]